MRLAVAASFDPRMSRVREALRLAALEFADRIYEILRDELPAEVREQLGVEASALSTESTIPPKNTSAPPPRETSLERIVSYLRQNPGTQPKELIADLQMHRKVAFDALAEACRSGVVVKRGSGPRVRYFLAEADDLVREDHDDGAPDGEEPFASTDATPLVERVIAFVREHPGCRHADLSAELGASRAVLGIALRAAKERGALRMSGEKIKARYFAIDDGSDASTSTRLLDDEAPPPLAAEEPGSSAVVGLADTHELDGAALEVRARDDAEAVAAEDHVATAAESAASLADIAPESGAPAISDDDVPQDDDGEPSDSEIAVAAADEVLEELDAALWTDMHSIRLAAELQAVVARIRELQPLVEPDERTSRRLAGAIRRVTAERANRDLPFIVGLKRDAVADWPTVARKARERVARFDRDANIGVPEARPSSPVSQRRREDAGPRSAPPREASHVFPALRAHASSNEVVFVGGIRKNELLSHIRDRYGFEPQWVAAQGANPRAVDALIERIRHGRVGAVVVLEGLFGHAQVLPLVAALKSSSIPFAYGDRAGTESLRSAFSELERTLSSRG